MWGEGCRVGEGAVLGAREGGRGNVRGRAAHHSPSSREPGCDAAHSATLSSCDGWNVLTAKGVGGCVISTRAASLEFLST